MSPRVLFEVDAPVAVVTLNRPEVRNAVDGATAAELAEAFRRFEGDDSLSVAVLTGAGRTFCSGADLKAFGSAGQNRFEPDGDAPMGPTRMLLKKPVLAAIEGHAVAGGLELALWCDLRIAAKDAVFGVFCRRFGVPLVDGGTVRLPRLVGMSHALDLILTGRAVSGDEALWMGLVNRLVEPGQALTSALAEARALARLPQGCLRSDRLSTYEQADRPFAEAMRNEFRRGRDVIGSAETAAGVARFTSSSPRRS